MNDLYFRMIFGAKGHTGELFLPDEWETTKSAVMASSQRKQVAIFNMSARN